MTERKDVWAIVIFYKMSENEEGPANSELVCLVETEAEQNPITVYHSLPSASTNSHYQQIAIKAHWHSFVAMPVEMGQDERLLC